MKTNFLQITTGLLLVASHSATTQSAVELEFYNCSNSPTSLCVTEPGVRLPDNNQSYLGESDPNASSCSVHFTQQVELRSSCSKSFQYKIEVSYYDTSAYDEIQSWTPGITDEQDEAMLTFETEKASDNYTSTNGLPYTTGCFRYHRIRWTVMDSCGNIASCDKRVELYDCHAPVPVSNQGFKILNFHSNYELLSNLDDLVGEYLDDCASSSQYLFSTQSNIYQKDTLFQYCEVPIGVLVIVPIWIADQGRDLNCNGIISWEERNKYQVSTPVVFTANGSQDCSNPDLFISGKIKTVLGDGIAKTHVMVKDVNQSYAPVITDENGAYVLPHINYTYPVTVSAARNDGVKNGVSTLDLVLIQKHLLGIESFTRPEQFIAADANNSKAISAIDLVVLRKLILGFVDTLPGGKSWRFYPADYVFPEPLDPWFSLDTTLPAGTFAESIVIPSENETADVDFVGIKLGDVNNNADPHFTSLRPRSNPPSLYWTTNAYEYEAGDLIGIPVKCTTSDFIRGFQCTLSNPDLEFLGIKEGRTDVMSDDYALMNDHLTVSWFSISPVDINPGDLLFTIVARAKTKGNLQRTLRLNSDITDAEMYSANDEIFIPKLIVGSSSEQHLNVFSAQPNPWSETSQIPFFTPTAGQIVFTAYSSSGAKIFSEEKYYSPGYHQIELKADDFSASGLIFYTVQSENESGCGKFMITR